MKKFYNTLLLSIFILPTFVTANVANHIEAEELFKAMRYDEIMSKAIDAQTQALRNMCPTMDQKAEAEMSAFMNKFMKDGKLRNTIIDLYAETFTQKELTEITAFYKTETGQKTLEKMPELMGKAMQLSHGYLMEHIDELQKILPQE